MKAAIVYSTACLSMASGMGATDKDSLMERFNEYIIEFNKEYTAEEFPRRFDAFVDNLKQMAQIQLENPDVQFAMNHMSDLLPEEHDALFRPITSSKDTLPEDSEEYTVDNEIGGMMDDFDPNKHSYPAKFTYYQHIGGCVSTTKDQGRCDGSWAYASTAVVEGAWCKAKGDSMVTNLSVQHLLDCDKSQDGCRGGSNFGWSILSDIEKMGLCLERDYPNEGRELNTCNIKKCNPRNMGGINRVVKIPAFGSLALVEALHKYGPVMGTLGMSNFDRILKNYKGNNLTEKVCDMNARRSIYYPDHYIAVVGYEFDPVSRTTFFHLKNSLGYRWGTLGYAKIELGACGFLGSHLSAVEVSDVQAVIDKNVRNYGDRTTIAAMDELIQEEATIRM